MGPNTSRKIVAIAPTFWATINMMLELILSETRIVDHPWQESSSYCVLKAASTHAIEEHVCNHASTL